jgi:hypothetical protein
MRNSLHAEEQACSKEEAFRKPVHEVLFSREARKAVKRIRP